jgi:hypothetical protein
MSCIIYCMNINPNHDMQHNLRSVRFNTHTELRKSWVQLVIASKNNQGWTLHSPTWSGVIASLTQQRIGHEHPITQHGVGRNVFLAEHKIGRERVVIQDKFGHKHVLIYCWVERECVVIQSRVARNQAITQHESQHKQNTQSHFELWFS